MNKTSKGIAKPTDDNARPCPPFQHPQRHSRSVQHVPDAAPSAPSSTNVTAVACSKSTILSRKVGLNSAPCKPSTAMAGAGPGLGLGKLVSISSVQPAGVIVVTVGVVAVPGVLVAAAGEEQPHPPVPSPMPPAFTTRGLFASCSGRRSSISEAFEKEWRHQ